MPDESRIDIYTCLPKTVLNQKQLPASRWWRWQASPSDSFTCATSPHTPRQSTSSFPETTFNLLPRFGLRVTSEVSHRTDYRNNYCDWLQIVAVNKHYKSRGSELVAETFPESTPSQCISQSCAVKTVHLLLPLQNLDPVLCFNIPTGITLEVSNERSWGKNSLQ